MCTYNACGPGSPGWRPRARLPAQDLQAWQICIELERMWGSRCLHALARARTHVAAKTQACCIWRPGVSTINAWSGRLPPSFAMGIVGFGDGVDMETPCRHASGSVFMVMVIVVASGRAIR